MIIFRKLKTASDETEDIRQQLCKATSENKKLKEDLQLQRKMNAELQHDKKTPQVKVHIED